MLAEYGRFLLLTSWWVMALGLAVALLRLVAWAFRRFDVSADSPA